jgi:hypothetical protein
MRITDPTALETLACREAIALALYLNINRILVASDCKGVVEEVVVGSLGVNGAVITKIRARSTQLQEFNLVFEGRASNFEPHNLARYEISLDVGHHVWLGNPYGNHIHIKILVNQESLAFPAPDNYFGIVTPL